MPTLIVPFGGNSAKQRLAVPDEARTTLAHAMLEDVVAACVDIGRTVVVSPDPIELDVEIVRDDGHSQGAAVERALDEANPAGPVVIVNADLPCATPRDLLALIGSIPAGGIALVEACDGTTNALALASRDLFKPVYGPGSAARFRRLAPTAVTAIPNLIDDVDDLWDLIRLRGRVGPHTRLSLEGARLGVPR